MIVYKDILFSEYRKLVIDNRYDSAYHVIGSNYPEQWWLVDHKYHRLDGPAYIDNIGEKWWYVNNVQYLHNSSFQKAANLTDEEMTILILKYGNIR